MATGTTDVWAWNRDQIVSKALANVGAIGMGDSAEGAMRDDAAERLNAIVKALDAEGQFLWRVQRLTTTTVASTAAYPLNAAAFAVDAPMRFTRAGQTGATVLDPMTRDEYMSIADRTNTGTPTRYLVESTLTGNGRTLLTATLWPTPDATGDTIEYAGTLRGKDFVAGGDSPDFPTAWALGLTYALSAELAPGYGQPESADRYERKAGEQIAKLVNADNETQDLQISPFGGCS